MEKIIYTNRLGDSITLDRHPPFKLRSKSGFETTQNMVFSQELNNYDGAQIISTKLDSRNMSINGDLVPRTTPYDHEDLLELRKDLISVLNPKLSGTNTLIKSFSVLNPKLSGTLKYINDIGEYQIDVEVISSPTFFESEKTYRLPFLIQLVALDPYWIDTTNYERYIPLSRVVNLFEFPLEITEGFEFATIESGDIEVVTNYGDIEVGVVFSMRIYGEVSNPRIYNVITQEYFGFSGTYQSGTEFKVDTRRGSKKVIKIINGIETNAMSERLEGSTFLTLIQGDNYLQVQADGDGAGRTLVDITLRPLVLGV